MTWRIAVRHTTTHRYANRVSSSYNEARVVPLTVRGQLCLESRIEVTPVARTHQYRDYWGTIVDVFDLHEPHTELIVCGSSVAETSPAPVEPDGVGWGDLVDVADRFAEMLAPTAYVPEGVDELAGMTDRLRAMSTPLKAARAAAEWVQGRLTYQPGATDVRTSAAEALSRGQGVCQDFAHLTLALLRSLAIPARYASGYLHPSADAEIGNTIEGQGHAWVEWWCGDWYPWDPTHGIGVGERHVLVGRGRDYADVPPLKGIYQGAPAVDHAVSVEITRAR